MTLKRSEEILRSVFVLLLCITFFKNTAFTQELPFISNYSRSDYSAGNQNWSVSYSPEGFLYSGNSTGLIEFDASVWKTYSLSGAKIVRAIYSSPDHRIYTGSYAEFGYWERDNNQNLLYHSLSKNSILKSIKTEEIWNIIPLDGEILFQSFSEIYLYDGSNLIELAPPGTIMFAIEDGHDALVQVIGKGIYRIQKNKFKFIPGTEIFAKKAVSSMVRLRPGCILIGTTEQGLFLLNGKHLNQINKPVSALLIKAQLNRMLFLNDGRLAFGTISNGLYICDSSFNVQYHISRSGGLQNNTVLSMAESQSGDLCLGLDRGLSIIHLKAGLTTSVASNAILGTVYSAAIYSSRLFVATNTGVYSRSMNSQNPGFFTLVRGSQGQAWNLSKIGSALICGHNQGTFQIQNQQTIKWISTITGGYNLVEWPKRNNYFVQGTYTGLAVYLNTLNSLQFKYKIKGYTLPVKNLKFNNAGQLICGNPYGEENLITLNEGMDSVKSIQSYDAKQYILAKSKTIRGLGNDFFTVFQREILFHGLIKTSSGYHFKEEWIDLSLVKDYENIIPLDSNRYLLCLDEGYAIFDKNRLNTHNTASPVVIRGVEVFSGNRKVSFCKFGTGSEKIILPRYQNQIHISFASPGLNGRPRFSTRLEGAADVWSTWDETPYKEFVNLSPGEYTFRVKSAGSLSQARLHFVILPPWYGSTWFFIMLVLVISSLLALAFKLHKRQMLNQQIRLETIKEAELKRQKIVLEQEFIKIQNAQLKEEVIHKSQELSNSAMTLIRKNQVLTELREELDITRSEIGGQLPTNHYRKMLRYINSSLSGEADWLLFEQNFNEVHNEFFNRLRGKHPAISQTELKLAACLRMNLSSKEIAPILNISIRGIEIKRYRLRKKLELPEEKNLAEYLMKV